MCKNYITFAVDLNKDEDFRALLPKDRFGAIRWEANNIYWVIREMEREV